MKHVRRTGSIMPRTSPGRRLSKKISLASTGALLLVPAERGWADDISLRGNVIDGATPAITQVITDMGVFLNTSTVTISGNLTFGRSNPGDLVIQNGGTLSNVEGVIGYGVGSVGSVTVSGPGSTWTNSGNLYVGGSETSNGTLTIQNGGKASNLNGGIGYGVGSVGSVTVSGPGSTWTNAGVLYVGAGGVGTLTIQGGGKVSSGYSMIGYVLVNSTVASGAVTVSGSGSTWTNNELRVGVNGPGALTIDSGGTVVTTNLVLGDSTARASGTLNLGAGGVLETGSVQKSNGTGIFNLEGGLLRATRDNSNFIANFGPTDVRLSGSSTIDTQAYSIGLAPALSGTDGLVKQGTGTLTLSAVNTYTGGTTIDAGTLALGPGGSLAATGGVNLSGAGATFDISGSGANQTIGALTGAAGTTVALGANTLTLGDNGPATFGGSIGGTGGVVKQGAGTQTLTGANIYIGGTTINAGTLALGGGGRLSAISTVSLAGASAAFDISLASGGRTIGGLSGVAGSTVALGANTLTLGDAASRTFAGSIGGTGGLVKQGSGTLVLSGSNTHTGGTTIAGGTLSISSDANLGATSGRLTFNGGRLEVAGPLDMARAISLQQAGEIDVVNRTTVRLIGVVSGPGDLIKTGASGILELANAGNAYGNTLVAEGGLIGNASSISGNIGVSNGAFTALDQASDGTFAGNIGSYGGTSGTMRKLGSGNLTLTGSSSLDWGIGSGGLVTAAERFTGNADIGSGASLTFDQTANAAYGAVLSGAGAFIKAGNGVLTLTGANTYGGTTLVSAGELRVDGALNGPGAVAVAAGATLSGTGSIVGAVTVDGTLSAGHSPGTLTVGSLTLNGGSTSIFELNTPGVVGGSDPVAGNDLVKVTGNLTLGGALDARAAAAGYYRLFDYGGTLSGSFASQNVTSSRSGFTIAGAQVETAVAGQVNLAVLGAGQTMQFWDGANATANGTVDGGAGTWTGFGTNWTDSTGSANAGWGGSVGIFAGAAGGFVSVASPVSFDTLQFSTDGYALSGGTLSIAPASGAAGTFTVDNGVLASIGSTIADGGGTAVLKLGSGTLVLSGSNTYTGGTAINGGVLQVSADANLGAASGGLSLDGGTLATTASFASFRAVTLAGAGGVDVAAGTQFELGGSISGPGSLSKLGTGTLLLSGFNTHSGGTVITAGILQAGSPDALGSGALTLDGGTFRAGTSFINSFANAIAINAAGGAIDVNGQVMTLSGNIADGAGGGGALAFVNSHVDIGAAELGGVNTYGGATSVGNDVTLIALSDTAFSPNSDVTLATTGALLANGRNVTVRSLSGAGAVGNGNDATAGTLTIALPSGTASFSGTLVDGEPGDAPLALVKTGAGTQILTGANTYSGGTTISGGILQIGDGGTSGSITGNVVNNRTLAFDRADNFTVSGTISGTGDVQKLGAGSLTLTGVNTYSGGTLISAGTLVGQASSFGVSQIHNNGALIIDQPVDAAFANMINGTGSLTKRGAGKLDLTGGGNLIGPTTVAAGKLSINGALASSAVTVLSGAALGGNGTVGATTVQSGATIAPGNSIGTLSVAGNLVLAPGSTYEVEIAGSGASDRIVVSGTTTVSGSQVGVTALDPQTRYVNGQRYTILTATGGVSGTAPATVSRSAFLDLSVDQQPNQVDLVIQVKSAPPVTPPDPGTPTDPGTPPVTPPDDPGPGTPPVSDPWPVTSPPAVFQTVAQTPNQLSTALALNTLPQAGGTLALYNSLLMLDAPSARAAFDALSGEVHASAKTALIDESWLLRNAMNDRLRSAFGAVGAPPMATMNYGFTADLAPSVKGPMPTLSTERFAVWGQGYGAWGRSDSDRNAAKLTRSTGGFLIGADVAAFDTLRFGLIAGYSRSEFDVKGRLSSGESDNYHLGLYGGGQWGALSLRTGASYTWHAIETSRIAAFAGFGNSLRADYNAGTAQVFGELGYRIDLGKVALEPFAGLAYVNLHTDGFNEIGGAAALSGRSDDTSLGYSTLGLRASTSLDLQSMALTLRGGLAWRHAFGDVDPTATLAFSGSNPFTVSGLPIARDAALLEAGLDLAISKSATLGLSYTGQLAQDAQDHAFKGNLAVRF